MLEAGVSSTPPSGSPLDGDRVVAWLWSALTSRGEEKRGEMQEVSAEVVRQRLLILGLNSIRVRRDFLFGVRTTLKSLKWWVTKRDRMIVRVQLLTLRESTDLSLSQCIRTIEDCHSGAVARRLRAFRRGLESGLSATDARLNFAASVLEPSAVL